MVFASEKLIRFVLLVTVVQFQWIAIWGFAQLLIDVIAKKSKAKEAVIYLVFLAISLAFLQGHPDLVEKL